MPTVTIIDAQRDPNLLGAMTCFRDLETWRFWGVFQKALYGLPLESGELEIFEQCTGRSDYCPPRGGWREAVAIVGRQSGKTRVAATLAAYEAMVAAPDADGGEIYALLIAQDHRAAMRALFSYVTAAVDASPVLRASVTERRRDSIALESGVRIATYPCRPAALRGLRARVVILDELGFFRTGEGYPADVEMLRAIRPTLATTGGKLVMISSPYGQSGALWDVHRKHFGRNDSPVLVWQASAPDMNPSLPADYVKRMEEEDPEAYRSEVLGEFRAGLATLFDPDVLDSAVASGRRELPPVEDVFYRAFVDPSGGRADAFTLSIGHRDGERVIVDLVRAWTAPLNPGAAIGEITEVLRLYGVSRVVGDRYGGEFPRERFRANGVGYDVMDKPKSDLYLTLLSAVNSGRVELPDETELMRELRGLERRRGSSGRDRVDHRPGAHDDRANAAAGLVDLLVRFPKRNRPIVRLRLMD